MNQTERKAWLAERKKGMGGTDVAAIMMAGADVADKIGSFDKSLFKIWSEKTGLFKSEDQDNAVLMRGRVMEKYVFELYELHLGEGCRLWERGLTWHPTRPRIFGTPDMMVEKNGTSFGMDAKTRRFRKGWGKTGTTDIPLDVEVQMRVYMEIFDAPYWDIATLFSLDDFRVYRIERDEELGSQILDVAEEWWSKYVDSETPPPPDGTDMCREALGKVFKVNPRTIDEPLRPASVAERDLYEKILKAKDEHKAATQKKNELENQLRGCIGESIGIAGVATWKPSKPRQNFDKKKFANDHPDMYKEYVTEGAPNRTLRVMEPRNDDSD
tara:strand:+ start:211 stop:1191 length:981 start_codon:yes stop_codon:yes gene_type:complete